MAIFCSRSWIILGFLVLLITSCGNQEVVTLANGEPDGKAIFNQNCTVCHGANGKLGIGEAADLNMTEKTIAEKLYIITNGSESGKMRPFKGYLTEKEIDAVANYTETLKK